MVHIEKIKKNVHERRDTNKAFLACRERERQARKRIKSKRRSGTRRHIAKEIERQQIINWSEENDNG